MQIMLIDNGISLRPQEAQVLNIHGFFISILAKCPKCPKRTDWQFFFISYARYERVFFSFPIDQE